MPVNGYQHEVLPVSTTIEIAQSYHFIENVFGDKSNLADLYRPWGRCLAIVDTAVVEIYQKQMRLILKPIASHYVSNQPSYQRIGRALNLC